MKKRFIKLLLLFLCLFLVGCDLLQGIEPTNPEQPENPGETEDPEQPNEPDESIPVIVTLEYNTDFGSDDIIGVKGEVLVINPTVENRGFDLEGWYFDEELTNKVPSDYVLVEDITIYAKWIVATSEINFYVDEVVYHTCYVEYKTKIEVPADPTKEGYTFVGWKENLENNELFDFDRNVSIDMNLYAAWQPNKFKVTYDLGYDTFASKEELCISFYTDFYNFMVEHTDADFERYEIANVEDFIEFARDWYANGKNSFYGVGDAFAKYYVTIEVGGVIENQPTTTFIGYCYQNGMYEEFIPHLMTFFAYWRTDEGYTGGSSDPHNTGNDFFASAWASLVDTCKFFKFTSENLQDTYKWFDSERVKDALDNIPGVASSGLAVYGDTDTPVILEALERKGYEFLGWFDSEEENANQIDIVTKEMTVYAKWKKID